MSAGGSERGRFSSRRKTAVKRDDEIKRLQAKVGEITMANALLLARARQAEAGLPLAQRRSRR